MRVPLSWLREYVSVPVPTGELAQRLVISSCEVTAIERRGVEMVLRYFPLHLLPEWRSRGHRPGECPVAERVWFSEQLNLPCYPAMSDAQLDHVIDAVLAAVADVRQ